jgi:DNA-binding transcriptional ArsR family regulator
MSIENDPRQVSDARALRALAHPVRIALLEALTLEGPKTATEVGVLIGESPTTCSFHLRQLARYGLVEEAGGGKGRARPWRASSSGFTFASTHDEAEGDIAANALASLLRERQLGRYREWLATRSAYPRRWRDAATNSEYLCYLTVAELEELNAELGELLGTRIGERLRDRTGRPPDAVPVELLLFAYPLRPPPETA